MLLLGEDEVVNLNIELEMPITMEDEEVILGGSGSAEADQS